MSYDLEGLEPVADIHTNNPPADPPAELRGMASHLELQKLKDLPEAIRKMKMALHGFGQQADYLTDALRSRGLHQSLRRANSGGARELSPVERATKQRKRKAQRAARRKNR